MNNTKVDIIILGAGLTGLTLAYYLSRYNVNVQILESRNRIGGRILTHTSDTGPPLEMGATWLGKQHLFLNALLKELAIEIFPQHMDEYAIYNASGMPQAQLVSLPPSQQASYRIKGGSSTLIQCLAQHVSPTSIKLGQQVSHITATENSIMAQTSNESYEAKVIVSTLPPKLLGSSIEVSPSLPSELNQVLPLVQTWMGDAIKVAVVYRNKFWEGDRITGTIFSQVGPVTEMYDHSNFEDSHYALKGFMDGRYYQRTKQERLALILGQLEAYYGAQVHEYLAYEEKVWRNDIYTSMPDSGALYPHQNNGHQLFKKSFLHNRLIIAGSETNSEYSGYMEGAVMSAKHTFEKLATDHLLS